MTEIAKNDLSIFSNNQFRDGEHFESNKNDYFQHKELFYSIIKNNDEYSASVYGIPEIKTEKHLNKDSCMKFINEKIDKYIIDCKIKLLDHPRPIPDNIDLARELLKASCTYELRNTTTTSLHNAFRKINEKTINILNSNYESINLNDLEEILAFNEIYENRHGDIIKKILNGLNLYDSSSGRQINLKDVFSIKETHKEIYCIYIPYSANTTINCELQSPLIKHYPNSHTNIYKFIFEPLTNIDSICIPIIFSTDHHNYDRVYLTISKINSDIYSYQFEGSINLNTDQNSIHLCAKKNFIDNLSSIIPKSPFQLQHFELLTFEIAKFIQYAIFIKYDHDKIYAYLENNTFLNLELKKFLIKADELEASSTEPPSSLTIDEDTIINTLYSIHNKKDISLNDFSILKEGLLNSQKLEIDNETIKDCTINCWRHIKKTPEDEIYATIVLLKIEEGLSDTKILDEICKIYGNFSQVRRKLHIRDKSQNTIQNKAQIINYRYNEIYKVAEKHGLPKPNLNKSKQNNQKSETK